MFKKFKGTLMIFTDNLRQETLKFWNLSLFTESSVQKDTRWKIRSIKNTKTIVNEKHLKLCTEAIKGSALAFEGVDDIHSSDGLPTGVFSVGNSITDDAFKE